MLIINLKHIETKGEINFLEYQKISVKRFST